MSYDHDSLAEKFNRAFPEFMLVCGWGSAEIYHGDELLAEIDINNWDSEDVIIDKIWGHSAGLRAFEKVRKLEAEVKELREMVHALLYAPGSAEYEKAKKNFEELNN
nr:hypothetical protein K-LCC10_0205 [Kaumoebavirus]